MTFPELEALAEECRAIDDTLAAVPADAWDRPALGSWNVAELVAHLARGVSRVDAYLDVEPDGPPVTDRISYWRYDADAESPRVAQRAAQEARDVAPDELVRRFTSGWQRSVDRAAARPPESTIAALFGAMRLDDYVATRVLEAVIHHLDLRIALDQPPVATPAAARITMSVLEGLLGEPRPRNLGRTRFLLAATGRIDVGDPRFPVLR